VSGSSAHGVDDTVVEVTAMAQWEDTSSCSEGHEDTSASSPEHVNCALQKFKWNRNTNYNMLWQGNTECVVVVIVSVLNRGMCRRQERCIQGLGGET
jgi:hypothetical protein